jgi:hypothetical protein
VCEWSKDTWGIDLVICSIIQLSFLWKVDVYNCVALLTISSFPYTSYLMHCTLFFCTLIFIYYFQKSSLSLIYLVKFSCWLPVMVFFSVSKIET